MLHILCSLRTKNIPSLGGSPGLVVMRIDSRSEGGEFESRHHILDRHFFTYICCKNCNVCLKRPKINEKEAGVGPFFTKNIPSAETTYLPTTYLVSQIKFLF